MSSISLERAIEAKVLGEEGYGLMTAPWELVQSVRWRVFVSRRSPPGVVESPPGLQDDRPRMPRHQAA